MSRNGVTWECDGGFATVLIIGGVIVASRQQSANRASRATAGLSAIEDAEDFEVPAPRTTRPTATKTVAVEDRPAARPSSKLLEGLKEELFELEVEHKQGRITQEEYEKTKSALDQTLQRALKRESQKT